MTQEHLHLQVRDEIGYLIIDRVDKRNAMSLDMWESMPALIARMTGDVTVKVLVVHGVDDTAFASGADIEEILQFAASETAAWRLMDAVRSAEQALADCPKPVIAMIRGMCVGGGIELALACDLRFASHNARFAIPPAKLGLVYSLSSTRRLIELLGLGAARDLLYSGRLFNSAEAQSIGLIERLFVDGEIEAETSQYARMLAERSQYSIRAAKRISAAIRDGASDQDDDIRRLRIGAFTGDDLKEGTRAFLEKRRPHFAWR
jgi:enoyl-CoA hydratase